MRWWRGCWRWGGGFPPDPSAGPLYKLHPARYPGFTHSLGGVTFLIIPVLGSSSNVRPIRTAKHPSRIISVIGAA